ncbi:MAG: ATP-binding cassette domain-containing protein [Clostridia bacterium]|jgi:tungstate transport system ATP-binding protein|nr:ATP-binding cassette domain-containing protein [Clostridia bacterium]
MPLFKLENISKIYANNTVLKNIDLTIESGISYAIIGPSGAGKSTLLRLMNLLELPSFGNLYYNDQSVANANESVLLPLRRQMTMVIQNSQMLAGTVEDNMKIGLKLRGLPNSIIQEKIKQALAFVGLKNLVNRKANTLSGGEIQRIALARAITLEPKVLFLDEPTANLDPQNVAMVESLISDIQKQFSTTVIIVTHNLFQAKRIAEEVIFMHQGKIIEKASAKTIFNDPAENLTKQFVHGTMIY